MPLISEETIQRVAEANDIVQVVGDYFPLRRAGTSWVALCPFHQEKSPSFHVNPQRQSFHCFGCGKGGSVIGFVMEYEHMDFPSAVRKLAQKAGIPVMEEEGSAQDDERFRLRKRLIALHAEAAAWFHHQLLKTAAAQPARDYLKSRGISAEVAKSWQLGYAPDSWDALPDLLREKRFSTEELLQSGLLSVRDDGAEGRAAKSYARFRGRVMFPIRNDYGEVIAFSGRVLEADAKAAKYVNSPETPIFTKGRVLYGLDKSKRALIDAKTAIVCEGQLDLISAFESGVQNVIAPQGTAFTGDQTRLLKRFVDTVILCFDSDRAGQEAIVRSLPHLLEVDLEVRVARLPEGEDPDSLIRGKGPDAFREAVGRAQNFFDHALTRMSERGAFEDPAGKADAARRLGPFVAMIKDAVLREATMNRICARIGVAPAAFLTHLKPPTAQPSGSAERAPVVEAIPLSEGIRQLCRYAMLSAEARYWLAERSSPPPSSLGQGGEILEKILQNELALEEPGARAAFQSTLTEAEQKTVSSLDLDRAQEIPLQLVTSTWTGLAAATLENQRESTEAQIKLPNLSREDRTRLMVEVATLQKQILDLKRHVNEG